VLAAVISPALRDRDSFPLSTYPMYAFAREDEAVISTAVGIDAAGTVSRLSLPAIADTDDPLIAESLVARSIEGGRASTLCSEIAARAPAGLASIEVVSERHDLVPQAAGQGSLVERIVHARCAVST
jgi:hypothetical protein